MRTFILALLFLVLDFMVVDAQTNYLPSYYIPAAGRTETPLNYIPNGTTYYVSTNGAVNMGSNSYTLTYASLPVSTVTWYVIFDATQLTGTNVNLFGETPLTTYPGQKYFFIRFDVVWSGAGTAKKVVTYNTIPGQPAVVNGIKIYGSSQYQPGGSITPKSSVVAGDDSGTLVYGCQPWCVIGNSGLNGSSNFLGTTDTASLSFRINNLPSGILSYNLNNTGIGLSTLHNNTTGTENTAFGRLSLQSNTTGAENTGIGVGSLESSTTGNFNSAVGYNALVDNTTGVYNTGIGYYSLPGITTGNYNTGVGQGSGTSLGTGMFNTFLGANTVADAAALNYTVALGALARVYSNNQLAISPAIQNILWQGHATGVNYVLSDSSGTGNFIPQPLFQNTGTTLTPLTGDSVILVYGKTTINPGSSLANLTLIMPSVPKSYQTYIISFQQPITALHISTRLSGGNAPNLPTSEVQGGSLGVYWDPNLSEWVAASH